MDEIWKDIDGYNGIYQISNHGNVRSLNYNGTGKIKNIKLSTNKGGYLQASLYKDGKGTTKQIHRFVADSFLSNPHNKYQVNHIDGNKTNNNIYNLEWCSPSENIKHSFQSLGRTAHNLGKKGKDSSFHKLVKQLSLSGEEINIWYGTVDAGKNNNIKHQNISACCRGEIKTAGGYIWKYI